MEERDENIHGKLLHFPPRVFLFRLLSMFGWFKGFTQIFWIGGMFMMTSSHFFSGGASLLYDGAAPMLFPHLLSWCYVSGFCDFFKCTIKSQF